MQLLWETSLRAAAWLVMEYAFTADRRGIRLIDALRGLHPIIKANAWAHTRGALVNRSKSRVECLIQLADKSGTVVTGTLTILGHYALYCLTLVVAFIYIFCACEICYVQTRAFALCFVSFHSTWRNYVSKEKDKSISGRNNKSCTRGDLDSLSHA